MACRLVFSGSPRAPKPLPARAGRRERIADEQRLGRMLDYAVIVPRPRRLYEWSAEGSSTNRACSD